MEDKINAAIQIQRFFRKYLNKQAIQNVQKSQKTTGFVHFDENCTDNDKMKAYVNDVLLKELALLNKDLPTYLEQKETLDKKLVEIDRLIAELSSISNLEECKKLTSNQHTTDEIVEEALGRHEKDLRKINLRWWEKLDVYN